MKLDVVYVQYDTEKYPGSLPVLKGLLQKVGPWTHRLVRVDNRTEGPAHHEAGGITETEGDNSFHEFSGWDKGLRALDTREERTDLFLFANDAFPAYGNEYEGLVSDETLAFVQSAGAVAGLIDRPEWKGAPLMLEGQAVRYWVRTSFFFVPVTVIRDMGSLVVIDPSAFLKEGEYTGNPFRVDAPMSEGYGEYLVNWVTRQWHSAFDLNETTLSRFRDKVRMIINEHSLTQKWRELGVPIYDLRFLKAFGERTGRSLMELKRKRYRAFRKDPITQLDFLHDDSLLRGLRNRLRLLGL